MYLLYLVVSCMLEGALLLDRQEVVLVHLH
jgi:hypothetical protein